ncbi:MAG TPA: hypothetical protein VJB57_08855 [Dehalococcoidia bacterium]|nr:hypothetical protein [Dehalococcoidia bacterium]
MRGLDTFCGGGGCSKGYADAGFEMYGIDNEPKMLAQYPFPFIEMDAMEAIVLLLRGEGLTFSNGETLYLRDFAFVHASPPCQGYSIMNNLPWIRDREYPLLILPVRELLNDSGLPYVIENVAGARFGAKGLIKRGLQEHGMKAGWLCGGMFGLPIYRHRYFETNWFWPQPGHPKHRRTRQPESSFSPRPRGAWEEGYEEAHPGQSVQAHPRRLSDVAARHSTSMAMPVIDSHKRPALHLPTVQPEYKGSWDKYKHTNPMGAASGKASLASWQGNGAQATGVGVGHAAGWRVAAEAMGIDWMKRHQLTQAVPPVMTSYLGAQLLAHIEASS